MRFMPRWAPEAKNESSSAAPQQAQQPQQAQGGGTNKANAGGAAKDPAAEKAKAKEEARERRLEGAKSNLKKLHKSAVSTLVKSKGYSKAEAAEIAKVIHGSVDRDTKDPDQAEATVSDYQNYLSSVPARKDGKGNMRPHGEWASAYASWLGGMKGVNPPNAAQIPISEVKGVTGKKKKKVSDKIAKHVVLVRDGLKTAKGGKAYDAYRMTKSTDPSFTDRTTVVRDGKKWFILKKDGSLEAIKRGKKSDPIFDERGILNIDPRFKEIKLVPKDGLDVDDINREVEAWIDKYTSVKTKRNVADKRAEHVKKALEKKLHGRFGNKGVSVTADGKSVMIRILGDEQQRSKRAKAVAAYMEDAKNKTFFESVFGDLAKGASIQVQKESNRISAGQTGTFSGVVSEIKKLRTHVTLPVVDVRKFKADGKDDKPDLAHVKARVEAHGEKPDEVVGKKVVVKLRYVDGLKPDDKKDPTTKVSEKDKIEKFVKDYYKKDGRTVEVEFVKVSAAKPSEYADKKKRAELKDRLVAVLWDGDHKVKSLDDAKEAAEAMIEAAEGIVGVDKKDNKRLVPMPFEAFRKSVGVKLRKQAEKMRNEVVAAKSDKAGHDGLMKAYKAWWGVAGKHITGASAEYYKPDNVKKASPRAAVVHKSKSRRGIRGTRKPVKPSKLKRERDPNVKKHSALMPKGKLKAMYASGLGGHRKPTMIGTGRGGTVMWKMPSGKIKYLPKGVPPVA